MHASAPTAPGSGPPARRTSSDAVYTDADGNELELRGSLTPKARAEYAATLGGGLHQEDAWQRATELLFERLAVSWTISGVRTDKQKELLGRYRMATAAERRFVRDSLRDARGRELPGGGGAVIDPDAFAVLIADWCLEVQPGQQILIETTTLAREPAVALHRARARAWGVAAAAALARADSRPTSTGTRATSSSTASRRSSWPRPRRPTPACGSWRRRAPIRLADVDPLRSSRAGARPGAAARGAGAAALVR